MKVLITGGRGYLGGRLARHLAARDGFEVTIGSRRALPPPAWCPTARTAVTPWDDEDALRAASAGHDAVVHLAGMNAQDSAADPVAALQLNGVGTARLARAAARAGVRRVLYVSTAHVYGSPLQGVIDETTPPRSLHPYATSHRAGEDAVLAAHAARRVEGIVVRLSNSFGVPVDTQVNCWMLLVNDLCRQAVVERQLTLRSTGLQRRDFITLHDACRAIEHLLRLEAAALEGAPYNAGGHWAPTVIEMTERIARRCQDVCGYLPQVVRQSPQPGEAAAPLEFRAPRLAATGFTLEQPIDAEIDATLRFCAAAAQAGAPAQAGAAAQTGASAPRSAP